jgi:hypothetical protein
MPFVSSIDTERRIAHVRGEGEFNLEEVLSAPLELFARPEFEPDFGVVVDIRAIQFQPTSREVIAIARNLVRFRALFEHRVALVVQGKLMLRAAEISAALAGAGGFSMRIFTSVDEAEVWVREDAEHVA